MKNNALKNTTVRLETDLFELVQLLARFEECAPSEFMRTAIRERIERLGVADPDGAGRVIQDFVNEQVAAQESELRRRLGAPDPAP